MSDVIQAFLPVFWEENRQECLYHGRRTDRNVCITFTCGIVVIR